MSRIAIVIGVNNPRAPAALRGAVTDAKAIANWIGRQGFEVKPFTDDAGPVRFADIFAEVERVVDAATYSQAVIYFAGHGLQNGGSEVWLLSGAPNNPSEAISIEASVMAARESGLTSVVFISDACRSIPAGIQNNRVDGISIFPNAPLNRATRPEIDRLFATLPSLVAVEAVNANDKARREGIFTREFMNGYRDPPTTFTDKVAVNGELIEVITNRKLKDLVRELVEDAAFEELPKAGQLPEFILESVDAYVGRVERAQQLKIRNFRPNTSRNLEFGRPFDLEDFLKDLSSAEPKRSRTVATAPSVAAVARRAIDAAGRGEGTAAAAAAVDSINQSVGIGDAIVRFSSPTSIDHFETRTGFSVTGARVIDAQSPLFVAERLGDQLVRLQPEHGDPPSASVLIEFEGGNGTVLPGLRGYIGHVFVDETGVANVNYVPSANTPRWQEYQHVRSRVEALRATVAAAAGLGVFRIAPQEARSFGDMIRDPKAFDPTLGLYAAYAYASAGLERDVQSVLQFMRDDLHAELFDIAMLGRRGVRPREAQPGTLPILPFCPMLRQGWSLLAVREAELPDAVRNARDWLLPSLWTTFGQEGVGLLKQAIGRGDFR
jgi:hypothetical protein